MVSSMNVITLGNSIFSSWSPLEASCTFFGCCVVYEIFEVLLVSSWVLVSVLFMFYFCCFDSSIAAFNGGISFDWFCRFVFDAFIVSNLDILLEYFKLKGWSFCCSAGLSPVCCVFWLILLDSIFVLFFKMLTYVGFSLSIIFVVCDVL